MPRLNISIVFFSDNSDVIIMDDDEAPVQTKGTGQGKGREHGWGKSGTSLPRPGKVKEETVPKKETSKKEDSKQKQKGVRHTRSTAEEETESETEAGIYPRDVKKNKQTKR